MSENPANNAILTRILERLEELDQKFTGEIQAVRGDVESVRQQMQEGFADAARDRQAIRQEMQVGFAAAAQERQAIYDKIIKQTAGEISATATLLFQHIEKNIEILRKESQTFQKATLEAMERFRHVLERIEQRLSLHNGVLERL